MVFNRSEQDLADIKNSPEFRDWLVGILKTEDVTVFFEKTDGTVREMKCTLKPDSLVPYEKKTDQSKTPNPDVCAVFDLDKQQWRSFRYDSIKEIRFTLG